ncbi:MAG: SH3 domain-containing protein [Finegoldia magna]|uniref:SH3 domain-containing protein n=1 Tax=Finegoldia magna TaxID=1260 RepID=UPI000B915BF4|nr:SH3 domain-containing protein [Finegoldia magna]MDU1011153.1 SH3 domain-containing protein [Finegoldia magna]MDU1087976.1 SH3 domain-containing protein [Finegoldia magna]OXZ37493.1 enterotoxin [Finegoldia magna]
MKRLIPIAILVLMLTTGCLRKLEHYESMRNTETAESVQQESTEQAKPEDSKPEETAEEKPASENTDSNKPEESTEKTMKVTTDILNMRSEASTNSSIVTKLKKNDELKVIEETKNDDGTTWVKVDFNGQLGFVSKEFLGE